ncbi:MAG: hypothetical protein EB069_08215 [Actinobacteria bacterium]|nr:hypothetical protein [Actinomycetota bacterium]
MLAASAGSLGSAIPVTDLAVIAPCRSCEFVKPIEGGWFCQAHDESLSSASQREGCGAYQLAEGFAQQLALEH